MGLLFSRFKRPQTTIEILEQIDKDISHLQKNRKENQDKQKKLVATLLIYSVIIYILAAVIFFLLYFPKEWSLRLLYSLPLLLFPFLIWGIKKLLHWYFVKRITSNDLALRNLRERKKQILEEVMETETYKKAREILEKFDPSRLRQLEGTAETPGRSGSQGTELHQRNVPVPPAAQTPSTFRPVMRTPGPQGPRMSVSSTPMSVRHAVPHQNMATMRVAGPPVPGYMVPPGPPMPRTILSKDRGVMDRMMDYLVGDGPENRYALICQQCHSHNGMALKEEFEYLSFRCCYCFNLNPARKQRPIAPRLEFFAPLGADHKSGKPLGSVELLNAGARDDSESSEGDNDDSPTDNTSFNSTPAMSSSSENLQLPQVVKETQGEAEAKLEAEDEPVKEQETHQ